MLRKITTNKSKKAAYLGLECDHCDLSFKPHRKLLKKVVADLMDTANHHYEICLGLSANQVGHDLRVFVFRTATGPFVPVVNPEIIGFTGGMKSSIERCLSRVEERGCLSPGTKIRRPRQIQVEFLDVITQKRVRHTLKGTTARVFLHELDHLNGKDI